MRWANEEIRGRALHMARNLAAACGASDRQQLAFANAVDEAGPGKLSAEDVFRLWRAGWDAGINHALGEG